MEDEEEEEAEQQEAGVAEEEEEEGVEDAGSEDELDDGQDGSDRHRKVSIEADSLSSPQQNFEFV